MKVYTQETTVVVKDGNNEIVQNSTGISYIIYPEDGKKLKEKRTGFVSTFVAINDKTEVKDFEEI